MSITYCVAVTLGLGIAFSHVVPDDVTPSENIIEATGGLVVLGGFLVLISVLLITTPRKEK